MEIVEQFETAARNAAAIVIHTQAADVERVVSDLLHAKQAWGIVSDSRRVVLDEFVRVSVADTECWVGDAEWGIAATGAVILPANASLLPVSIVILDAARILRAAPATAGCIYAVNGLLIVVVSDPLTPPAGIQ